MAQALSLDELVRNIPSFRTWSVAEKILFFVWYLQTHRQRSQVAPSDVVWCFKEIHIGEPASLGPYVKRLVESKPPRLLKDSRGYRLERSTLERFDKQWGERESTITLIAALEALPKRIPGLDEREYLNEALICFKHRAFRAAIVMSWNLAYSHFLAWLLADATRLSKFNAQLLKTAPEVKLSSGVVTFDDFGFIKEDKVLLTAKTAALIPTNLHKAMKDKLELRNSYAHPSTLVVTQLTAEEAIQNLVDNVVLRLT